MCIRDRCPTVCSALRAVNGLPSSQAEDDCPRAIGEAANAVAATMPSRQARVIESTGFRTSPSRQDYKPNSCRKCGYRACGTRVSRVSRYRDRRTSRFNRPAKCRGWRVRANGGRGRESRGSSLPIPISSFLPRGFLWFGAMTPNWAIRRTG